MADRTVVINADQAAREELVRELEELKKNPPDEAPNGGVFQNADGKGFHNAHGQPVTEDGKPLKAAEVEEAEEDEAPTKSTRRRR